MLSSHNCPGAFCVPWRQNAEVTKALLEDRGQAGLSYIEPFRFHVPGAFFGDRHDRYGYDRYGTNSCLIWRPLRPLRYKLLPKVEGVCARDHITQKTSI